MVDFVSAVKAAMQGASKDKMLPVLNTVTVNIPGRYVVATDRFCIALVRFDEPLELAGDVDEFTITLADAKLIAGVKGRVESVRFSERVVTVVHDMGVFQFTHVEGFPPVRRLLPDTVSGPRDVQDWRCVNPDYVARVAAIRKALGRDYRDHAVIEWETGADDRGAKKPHVWTIGDVAWFVLMPVRFGQDVPEYPVAP